MNALWNSPIPYTLPLLFSGLAAQVLQELSTYSI